MIQGIVIAGLCTCIWFWAEDTNKWKPNEEQLEGTKDDQEREMTEYG